MVKDEHRRERENRRRARMVFRDENGPWYALDNAAVIMPANSDEVATALFRFSADLDETVNLPALQAALDRVIARFPYFNVELGRGFFWHYLEPCRKPLRVTADAESPCQGFTMHRRGTCLVRVRARGRRVAVECCHIVTDGTGGIRFLKNLLVEYWRQRGLDPGPEASADPDLYDLDAPVDPEELEDAYNRYFPGLYPHPPYEGPAFQLDSRLLAPGDYRVTSLNLSLRATLAVAKGYGASLTELLTAVYMDVLQSVWLATPERRRRRARLAIEVPVNMRKFYETKSMRNFSLFVHAEQDMRLGPRAFDDQVAKVHHFLRYEIDKPNMTRHISRNVQGGRLLPVRVIPLPLKTPLMRFLYAYYGEVKVSGVLSNIGPVSLPGPVAARVARLDMFGAPSRIVKTKLSVLSFGDRLVVGFASLARSREIERLYAERLRSLGLAVLAESNI